MIKSAKQITHKFLASILIVVMIMTVIPVGVINVSAASYSSDWTTWSQGASDYADMRDYGCWVVAQARLIRMLGIDTSSTFNPDVYLVWEQNVGHINSQFDQLNGDIAPVDYAASKGKQLTYKGIYYSVSAVWNCINNGEYGIVCVSTANSPTGNHWMLLDNEKSASTGSIYCYDSWTGHSNSKSLSLGSMSYTFYSIYTYSYSPHTHSYGSWQTVTAATCTSAGSSRRVCSCGDIQQRTDAALGHSWNSGEITKSAGCTEEGVREYTCTRCGATKTEAVSAIGHSPVIDPAVPATCTETGLTEGSHCSVCNAIITEQQTIPAHGHKNNIESIVGGCETVTVYYRCEYCNAESNETRNDYVYSEWSEDYPVDVDESLIESKTQYAYSDKETTSSELSELSGWTPNGKERTGWTSETGPVYLDPTNGERKVRSESYEVSENTKRVWHYSRGISGPSGWNNYAVNISPDCNLAYNQYITLEDYERLTKRYENWQNLGALYGSYIYNGFDCPYWFNEWSEYVHVSYNYGTCWYYQEPVYTYYYYKWSDYSEWSDTVYEESETRQVKTRTVYRYKVTPGAHSYGEWQIRTQATCVNNGEKYRVCSVCGNEDTAVINKLNHNPSGEWLTETPATCVTAGLRVQLCTRCTEVCSEEIIPPTGMHTYGAFTKDAENHWQECSVCNHVDNTEPHTYTDSSDDTCNICGYEREIVPEYVGFTWELNGTELIISGSGNMPDYTAESPAPWGTDITSVIIQNGVTSIGDRAFYNCNSLSSIQIPNGVTRIGASAFQNCKALTSVTMPNSVTEVGRSLFYGCSALETVVLSNNLTIIENSMFDGCTVLDGVVIPNSVTRINGYAFSSCRNLKSIEVPAGVTKIGMYAFYKCDSLKTAVLPDSVTSLEEYAFHLCSALETVNIPTGITAINTDTFYGCEKLDGITIPENVISIGSRAFYGCLSLSEINIPNGVTSIGDAVFQNCKSLKSIVLPDVLTEVGRSLFYGCSALETAVLSNNLTVIENSMFDGCTSLDGVIIPDSVTRINGYAFSSCRNLKSINIPASVTVIGQYAFYGCRLLTSAVLPDGVTKLEKYAFCNCTALEKVKVPGSVTDIGEKAFNSCPSVKILLKEGSVAFTYAVDNELAYSFIGDINEDNEVNVKDIARMKKIIVGDINDYEFIAVDLNSDGKFNVVDYVRLKRILAGIV